MKRKLIVLASMLLGLAGIGGCRPAAPAAVATLRLSPKEATARLFDSAVGETRALIVMRNGKIVLERYADGFDANSRFQSWSLQKTITAVLAGMMIADGRLQLDDQGIVRAWDRSGDPRAAITLRHLLSMTAGLRHSESGDPPYETDAFRLLYGEGAADTAAYAEGQPLEAKPGERFLYSTAASTIAADVLTSALTDSPDPATRRRMMRAYVIGRLAEPLGMTSYTPEFDAKGTMIGGAMGHATARDYAKFGEMLRRGGLSPAGERIVPESWIAFMRSKAGPDAGYGAGLWRNRPRPAGRNDELWPADGPADLFAGRGKNGQFIIISPGQRLTVVRLGITRGEKEEAALRSALRDLVAAY